MTDTTDDTTGRRGRPRSQVTIDRDAVVYAQLKAAGLAGITRATIIANTGLSQSQAYLSLWRLRTAGQATRQRIDGKHVWFYTEPTTTDESASGETSESVE